LKKLTGVDIEKMLPTPNISLDKIPESQNYLRVPPATVSLQPE
jgi:Mn-containing catalase